MGPTHSTQQHCGKVGLGSFKVQIAWRAYKLCGALKTFFVVGRKRPLVHRLRRKRIKRASQELRVRTCKQISQRCNYVEDVMLYKRRYVIDQMDNRLSDDLSNSNSYCSDTSRIMIKDGIRSCATDLIIESPSVRSVSNLPDLVPNLRAVEDSVRLQDQPLYYLRCSMEENCLSNSAYVIYNTSNAWRSNLRRLLRFSTVVHNRGNADFKPYLPRGQWQWHACHMHYHSMEIFAHYDILDRNGTRLAQGSKASFCLEDSACDQGVFPQFNCKGYAEQDTVSCAPSDTVSCAPSDTVSCAPSDTVSCAPSDTVPCAPSDTVHVPHQIQFMCPIRYSSCAPSDTVSCAPSDTVHVPHQIQSMCPIKYSSMCPIRYSSCAPSDTVSCDPSDTVSCDPSDKFMCPIRHSAMQYNDVTIGGYV
ncbi:Lysyl oxidase 2B [Bulinus truncatus]|nr:Lysyl oxidase 2B [Bulinus truncatus]